MREKQMVACVELCEAQEINELTPRFVPQRRLRLFCDTFRMERNLLVLLSSNKEHKEIKMANKLTREDLYSLEKYAEMRSDMRAKVMEHKKSRNLPVGPNVTMYFEDRLTIQYQIQEMLRAEKIFDAEGINEELDAYNPLIPDGTNWKGTMMIEYVDVNERVTALEKLIGIDRKTWVQVEGFDKVFAISNEDLERETEEKTSAVHFMRFELAPDMIAAAKEGAAISVGIDHENYLHSVLPVPDNYRQALVDDLG